MTEDSQQQNAIVPVSPRHMGDRQEISAVKQRILEMMPGAATFPMSVLWAAAQMAVAYRLDPFNGEIYIAKMGSEKVGNRWVDKYSPIIGVKGFRTLARRASHYVIEQPIRVMQPEEVKELRGELYEPEDVGVELKLFRLDVARQCKEIGIDYYPVIARGLWRKKAKAKRDDKGNIVSWSADNIPETWTRLEVAEKRAEKSAITKAFDLRVPTEQLADESFDYDIQVSHMLDDRDRETAIQHHADKVAIEEDGDMLYATE